MQDMSIHWYDWVGLLGVICILISYLLLQLERLSADSLNYSLANLIGALLIILSLLYEFNLSAMIIESAWAVISIFGVVKFFKRKVAEKPLSNVE
ncbi:MAG: hypothetical protein OQK04_15035 [Kangiellaceae bacterium]|nr:hypothetical protein [Kangiellaceae bacterium]MCW9000023.1 hypothetical protein [Kangiellaceae bacterium]